jgi:PTS system cellobiose-specific IIB component
MKELYMAEKTIRVLLVCAAGMSSSMLEDKIRKAAASAGRDIELKAIDSMSITFWDFEKDRMDVILVAPQVRFKKRGIAEKAEPQGTVVQDIDTVAYGMMDGEKILAQVLEAIKK